MPHYRVVVTVNNKRAYAENGHYDGLHDAIESATEELHFLHTAVGNQIAIHIEVLPGRWLEFPLSNTEPMA